VKKNQIKHNINLIRPPDDNPGLKALYFAVMLFNYKLLNVPARKLSDATESVFGRHRILTIKQLLSVCTVYMLLLLMLLLLLTLLIYTTTITTMMCLQKVAGSLL